MTFGLVFWILMLLWFVFFMVGQWRPGTLPGWGGDVLLFILFLLLGWHDFGAPVHP